MDCGRWKRQPLWRAQIGCRRWSKGNLRDIKYHSRYVYKADFHLTGFSLERIRKEAGRPFDEPIYRHAVIIFRKLCWPKGRNEKEYVAHSTMNRSCNTYKRTSAKLIDPFFFPSTVLCRKRGLWRCKRWHSEKNIGVILGSCVGGAASRLANITQTKSRAAAVKRRYFRMGVSAIANNVSAHFELEGITANMVNACAARNHMTLP